MATNKARESWRKKIERRTACIIDDIEQMHAEGHLNSIGEIAQHIQGILLSDAKALHEKNNG